MSLNLTSRVYLKTVSMDVTVTLKGITRQSCIFINFSLYGKQTTFLQWIIFYLSKILMSNTHILRRPTTKI